MLRVSCAGPAEASPAFYAYRFESVAAESNALAMARA